MMGEIRCDRLTKIWGAGTHDELITLEDISFSVKSGEFVVIIGPSGCGKSTLLSMLAGLEMPSAGMLLHNDQPITGPSPDRSLIFQQPSLLPWLSLIDNVAFGLTLQGMDKKDRIRRAEQFLSDVGLRQFANKYPHQLSGGMQQRACIARALCLGADIILMDEPFAALDVQTRYKMQKFLLDIWEGSGKTVIFVTHHIDEAVFLADRVIILSARPGRILDSVSVDMPRPRNVISPEFERHRTMFVEHLRSEVSKAFEEQELAEMLDTRIK
ncbi:MAG: ABC transporter ATP-binding protein [Oculatellaceae cyanobacterium Prado106]|jgi:NitT/TauT family transport system ATP-binding protein|nr:ABC transporter ATP-binding protein [Oculatellaceae cyanobacterium Prado106]